MYIVAFVSIEVTLTRLRQIFGFLAGHWSLFMAGSFPRHLSITEMNISVSTSTVTHAADLHYFPYIQ